MDKKELTKEVADKYQVLGGHGVGEYHFQGHIVHLQNLTIKRADELVELGFPYLVAKEAAKTSKPATSETKA